MAGQWEQVGYGFDNIGASLLSLTQMLSLDQWMSIMLSMIDARDEGFTPQKNYQPLWALFAIGYMLMGSVVLVGMYTCIIFECFYAAKLEYCGAVNCNLNEQQWINIQRFMLRRSLRYNVYTNRIEAK